MNPPLSTLPARSRDRSVAAVEADLAIARQRTYTSLLEVQASVRETVHDWTDWRALFAARPEVFVGAAFLAGFLYGNRR